MVTTVQRDPLKTQANILQAAEEVFAEVGFAGARVDEIAQRAGTNKRMIYHYFQDKAGLFRVVLDKLPIFDSPEAAHLDESETADPTPQIHRLAQWLHNDFDDTRSRLLAWQGLQEKTSGQLTGASSNRSDRWRVLNEQLNNSQGRGELPAKLDTGFMAMMLVSLRTFAAICPEETYQLTGLQPGDANFARQQSQFMETLAETLSAAEGAKQVDSQSPLESLSPQDAGKNRKRRYTLKPNTRRR